MFRFRTREQAAAENEGGRRWMRVSDALELRETKDVIVYISDAGIGTDPDAMKILSRLHEVVHLHGVISPFIEPDQSIDRVMNIFIRVNAQGEPLSFADLLLSQGTAAWSANKDGEAVDAREEIRSFNEHLNRPDHRFDFKRDQIMKACLVLTDATSVASGSRTSSASRCYASGTHGRRSSEAWTSRPVFSTSSVSPLQTSTRAA